MLILHHHLLSEAESPQKATSVTMSVGNAGITTTFKKLRFYR